MPFLASILVCCFDSDSVFAHTATLTTSSSVSLDALPSHDGVAIDEESINVTTTCQAGYNLSVATSTSSDLYLNGDGTTTATFTAVDGTSTLANSDNKWGYSLTANASSSTVFSPLSTTASVLKTTSQTASQTDIDDTFSIYYGTKATSSVAPGSYQMANNGAIVYYLTMDTSCDTYTIAYDDNNATAGTMGIQTKDDNNSDLVNNSEVTLFPSNFNRVGYGFAGWSLVELDPDSANFSTAFQSAINAGKVFGPQETITLDSAITSEADSSGVITMYAIWIKAETGVTLQTWNGCSAMTATTYTGDATDQSIWSITASANSLVALKDERDNETYAIAKLTDGNCWMIENLRLADTHQENNLAVSTVLTTSNTNNPLNNGTNVTLKHDYADTITYTNLSSTSSSWCGTQSTDCLDQSRLKTDNTANRATYTATQIMSANANIYSYGNYYNWYSATAGRGTYDSTWTVNGDICPTGWHLPYGTDYTGTGGGGNSGGFYYLATSMSAALSGNSSIKSKKHRHFPNNYTYSGVFSGAMIISRGSSGSYWTSAAGSNGMSYSTYLASTSYDPSSGYAIDKFRGVPMRCVASTSYTVSFNANGGTGTMNDQSIPVGTTTNLTSNSFTRSGYEFTGWNTKDDGTGTSYTDGQSVTDIASPGRTITLYAQWKQGCFAGYICYLGNGFDEGTMGRQSASDGNTVKLFASNYSRDGYGFAGWTDTENYATNPNAHFYGPNEDITVPTGTTANGLKLYAVWIQSVGTMQSNTASVCNNLTAATYSNEGDSDESTWSITANLNSISALTDNRDGQTYAIAKLSDGKCWMIENLRLADTHKDNGNNVNTTLTKSNTNNPLYSGSTVTLKHNYSDSTTYTNLSPTSNVAYNADTAPSGWCTTNSVECHNQSRLRTDNTANRATYTTTTNMTSHSANLYSYGNYYNWYSATAGRGTYSTAANTVVTGDLCPTGWHLPTGSGSGDYGLLSNSLGGYKNSSNVAQQMSSSTAPTQIIMQARLRHFPNNIVYSGYTGGGSISSRGSILYAWTATAQSNNSAYTLRFNTSYVNPGTVQYSKSTGNTVRCIASST